VPWEIDVYRGTPRYDVVRRMLGKGGEGTLPLTSDDVLKQIEEGRLVGKGGPGERTAKKWSQVRETPGDVKYIVCNGDESEPGTFKDRELLQRAPHLVVEGVIVAGLALEATAGFIYIRHEYPPQIAAVRKAIADAVAMGVCGKNILGSGRNFPVQVVESPGGYICGEQTALIEAMEGHRGEPRNRPPDLTTVGFLGKPTLINNVETYSWVPSIILNQPKWYVGKGIAALRTAGMRLTSISGDVKNPGVYEVPLGATVGEVIERAGGMRQGEELQAFGASGPSGGFLPAMIPLSEFKPLKPERLKQLGLAEGAKHLPLKNLPLDNTVFRELGMSLGAAHFVLGSSRDLLGVSVNATEFFRNESCGKCVPCRIGSQKLVELAYRIRDGHGTEVSQAKALVDELSIAMTAASICGLGQVAAKPLANLLKFFPHMFAETAYEMSMAEMTYPDE
jgi:NADH:ubiquinone oxidoreductase subunit F (NADH-binding)